MRSHSERLPAGRSGFFLSALVDALAPAAAYALLHALGIPSLVALLVGSVVAVVSTAVNTLRRRRLDGIGVLVLLEIAASVVLQLSTRDARLLLLRPSLYTGIGAVYLVITAFGERPLTYEGAKPIATRGDPQRMVAYERTWERSAAFRRIHRAASAGWGLALLADAVLRVVIVSAFPVERAAWLALAPHLTAIALLCGFGALVGRRARPLVEEQLRQMAAERAAV